MITLVEGQSEVPVDKEKGKKGKKKIPLPDGAHWARVRGTDVMVDKEGVVIKSPGNKFNGLKLKGKKPAGSDVGGGRKPVRPGLKWGDLDRSGKGKFKKVRKDIMDILKTRARARKLEDGRRR